MMHRVVQGMNPRLRSWPLRGWIGLGLVILFWILNWSLSGLRTHWGFFPLWLGYCLTVDALVFTRKGHSLSTRSPANYVVLFLVSVPVWWLFEAINLRTQNWIFDGRQYFSNLQYFLLASLSFSTVVPAVFGTAELVSTFNWIKCLKRGPRLVPEPATLLAFFSSGWLMLVLPVIWPTYFFPLVWISLYLISEPLNVWLGNRSLAQYTTRGDWRPVLALWVGCLICGFFWEMWNFKCYPKWLYRVPFVDFLHIFEMPLLGYGGYLPFALELFALYHLVAGFLLPKTSQYYIQISPEETASVTAT